MVEPASGDRLQLHKGVKAWKIPPAKKTQETHVRMFCPVFLYEELNIIRDLISEHYHVDQVIY